MKSNELPKVLVVDVNAWREDAPSNTLLDIFRCWDSNKLAVVYTSSVFPATNVSKHFFQIGETQVLQSVLRPWIKVGRRVDSNDVAKDNAQDIEQALRNISHGSRTKWMRIAREFVWKFGHWKTTALRDFIDDFDPDVLFVPIFPYAYMGRLQKYIVNYTAKPMVCYLADDNYSFDACVTVIDYIVRFWNRKYVRYLAKSCSEMFVIIDKEKEDTDAKFGTDSVILTKSVDFSGKIFTPQHHHTPIRFVYTGSLAIGRDNTLTMLADAINRINRELEYTAAELFIYSQTRPNQKILKHLDVGSSHFCGMISHQKIETILKEADVVVFAESLSGKQANVAKLSFSTKLTDYLSNAKCILAIGKQSIAPIDYLKRNNAAIIASSASDIYRQVKIIISNPVLVNEYAENAFKCAVINHNKENMSQRFIATMCRAAK